MEVYQITTVCAECKYENRVIIAEESASAPCDNCGASLLRAKRFDGVIYVMSNPRVQGVKIGMTRKNAFNRAKQISGTGVPGSFSVIAAFPSNNTAKDERKVHEKLIRKRMSKEHYELDAVTAVLKVRTILGKEWVYLSRKHERLVIAALEEQREKAKKRFAGKTDQPSQIDMFGGDVQSDSDASAERIPIQADDGPDKPKGFLATLFR